MRIAAGEALTEERPLNAGAVAVMWCPADLLLELSGPGWFHPMVIPAAVVRTQADLVPAVAALLWVEASCRALWLEPTEAIDLGPDPEETWPTNRLDCRACGGIGTVETSSLNADGHPFGKTCGSCHGIGGVPWVICRGGEKPVHPAWVRSIRDQCAAKDVPFAFLGWGDWVPIDDAPKRPDLIGFSALCVSPDGLPFYRVGAERSGAMLDGREWDERPEIAR